MIILQNRLRWLCIASSMLAIGAWLCEGHAARGESGAEVETASLGTAHAREAIHSGIGTATVRHWVMSADRGDVNETKSVESIAFVASRSKLVIDTETVRNDISENMDPKLLVPVGTKAHQAVALNGNRLTLLKGTEASIGDYATDKFARATFYSFATDVLPLGIVMPGDGLVDISKRGLGTSSVTGIATSRSLVGHEAVNGDECIIVELTTHRTGSALTEFSDVWVDPAKGFTVPRVRMYLQEGSEDTRYLIEESQIEVKQYAAGVWFPAAVRWTRYTPQPDGSLVKRETKEITYGSDFQINVPVEDNDLTLALPPGTHVVDHTLDLSYTVP